LQSLEARQDQHLRSSILKMRFLDSPKPLVVLVGPTAVGKTEVSLQLAERLDGEVVSADSRLFYRGMDIGTAKATPEERRRVPHFLIDVADPDATWSLAVFQREARKAIEAIHGRGRLPLLVGGTGQYIRAVIEGWEVPAQVPDERLRAAIEKWVEEIGVYGLHERLATLDPQAAARIDPRNLRRTVRALEVIFRTGELFSVQRQKSPSPYSLLLIGLTRPRTELYARIDERIDAMLAAGFEDEVRILLARGYTSELPTLSAIGYREMAAVLRGEISLDQAVVQIKRLTRQFVRRQANWFKESDPSIHWFRAGSGAVDEIEKLIRSADLDDELSHTIPQ
jgi:tRNA dimethylallyltransferase